MFCWLLKRKAVITWANLIKANQINQFLSNQKGIGSVNTYLSIKDAAKRTGLSESTLRRCVRAKRLPAFRAGSDRGKILFNEKILDSYIEQLMLMNVSGFFDDEDDESLALATKRAISATLFDNMELPEKHY